MWGVESNSVWVFAPSPLLTVTIESAEDLDEIHLHAGGQGYWLARLVRAMGVDVVMSSTFGGEVGRILKGLLSAEGFDLRAVSTASTNGAYIHDRRSGERTEVASMSATPLSRHEIDELYGASLVAGLNASVCVLGGPSGGSILSPDIYRRLASDLRANDKVVVADLSGSWIRQSWREE